jgi:hypothetical protein
MMLKNKDSVDLKSLEYPMFKTTFMEKIALLISLLDRCTSLCLRIPFNKTGDSIRKKIRGSLGHYAYLTGKLDLYGLSKEDERRLRDIWTWKLLKYKGE